MASHRDPEAESRYIEQVALTMETLGSLPRIAGRIFGLLLVSPEPHLSQAEIATALGISAASASSMTRLLLDRAMIQRVAVPGSRRDRLGLAPINGDALARKMAEGARAYAALAEEGLALPGLDISPSQGHLKDLRDLFDRVADVIEETLDARQHEVRPRKKTARALS